MRSPSLFRQYPGPARHRRLMAHMLPMAAGQVGHPILIFVEMIPHDRLIHLVIPFVPQLD